MASRVTVTLHELVFELDQYAERYLQAHHGVSFKLFEFVAAIAEVAPVDLTGLAHCLGVSKAAVSKRVPALEREGWITTTPGQGRQILLGLTEKGAELVTDAGGALEAQFADILADPRLNPAGSPAAIDAAILNAHLTTLTALLAEKSPRA